MTSRDDLPAEVFAAQNAIGKVPGGVPPALTASAPTSRASITPAVDELLGEILDADNVDIVGILPWQCAGRLAELEAERVKEGMQVIHPAAVRYFTPASDVITLYRHSGVMGTLVQRWIAGTTGLRNWLRPLTDDPQAAQTLSIFEFDDVYLDCLVHTSRQGRHTVTILTQLPVLKPQNPQLKSDETTLVITRMDESQVEKFQEYLTKLESQSRVMLPRQILCRPDSDVPQGGGALHHEFRPIIVQLIPHRTLRPANTVSPGAVVAICSPTAHGWAVVLKRRTTTNSVEDFDTLALISERVLEADLPSPLSGPLDADHGRALEDLWLRAGQPSTFELPEEAFRHAAQRELFLSCGLDVPASRLELRGTCLIEREDENQFLGFYVYRLDLVRSPGFDELAYVRAWNLDLQVVPFESLREPGTRHQLNRLLRQRSAWLREVVFAKACGETAAE